MTIKKIFVPGDSPALAGLTAAATRLGAVITADITEAGITHVLPLSDRAALQCAQLATDAKLGYLTPDAMVAVSDKLAMTELPGMPTMPTIVPKKPTDLSRLPNAPLLVKKRRTIHKVANFPYAYQVFASRAALAAVLDDAFWAYQSNPDPDTGEYVAQVAGDTKDGFVLLKVAHFAVNGASVVRWVRNTDVRYRIGASSIYDAYAHVDFADLADVMAAVEQVVAAQCITNALMSVQFVRRDGQWHLMDWNFRPGQFMLMVTATQRQEVFDHFLGHVLDIATPPPAMEDVLYYRALTLPAPKSPDGTRLNAAQRGAIDAAGLAILYSDQLPRSLDDPIYVYGTGTSRLEIETRFAGLQEALDAAA